MTHDRGVGPRRLIWGVGLGAALLLAGACEPRGPTDVGTAVPLRITAVVVGVPISTLVVDVTAADIATPLVFNLEVVNGVAAGTIKLPPGPARTIHVMAVDDAGNVTHEGSTTVDVQPGQNAPLQIRLAPRSGHVPITVTFGNYGVVLTPPAATIDAAVATTLQLAVTVTDVDGNAIPSAEVGWATTNPAVATVDAAGLVTGHADGSATIVATFEGVAGLSAVTVTGFGTQPPPPPPPGGPQATDFYVAFPANVDLDPSAALSLEIVGAPGTEGTVEIPGLGFAAMFTTDGAGLASVTLPQEATLDAWDQVQPRGVIVHAADSVGVLAISDKPESMAAVPLLPAQSLGTRHWVLSAGSGTQQGSFLALVGTEDVTTVTITPSMTAGQRPAQQAFLVTLGRGEAYQLEADGVDGDLSGTLVESDHPIALFAGHILGTVSGGASGGLLWAALPPVSSVTGTDFVAWPLTPRSGYWLRVLAFETGTTLVATGVSGLSTILNAGEASMVRTTTAAHIISNQPILVAQVAEGGTADAVEGADPCFALLPPAGRGTSTYRFTTPDDQVATRYANIVASSGAVGTIQLNGTVIDPAMFSPLGSSGHAGGTVPLGAGVNMIESSGTGFEVVVYGWGGPTDYNGFCFSPTLRF